jgi:aspartyl-tRNA(Asn)/glutamyl-tRNA(Gln) amidotransferase subunit B
MTRQAGVLLGGAPIIQETRHFDEATGTTRAGRRKETSEDYRYFPEPDLVPIAPPAEWVEELRATLPELPWARRARVKAEWGLSDPELRDLVNAGALDLIADTVAAGAPPAEARSWWVSYLAQQANVRGVELVGLPITPAQVARVIELVSTGELTNKLARQVVDGVLAGEGDPDEVVERRGLKVVSDEGALVAAVDEALACAAGHRREDPRRQGGGGGRDRRRGDEGDQGAGGRQARPRAGDRARRSLSAPSERRVRSGPGLGARCSRM